MAGEATEDDRLTQEEREARDAETDPVLVETQRVVRRVGYAIFFPLAFGVFLPIIFSVGAGIAEGEVWDPVTDQPVIEVSARDECLQQGSRLVEESRHLVRLDPRWDRAYFTWVSGCRDDYQGLYEVLRGLRTKLRKKQLSPAP